MKRLANTFPSVTWKRSDDNYMIDVLEYEPQRKSFQLRIFRYGCNIRKLVYAIEKTSILRDSVVRHSVSVIHDLLCTGRTKTYQEALSKLCRELLIYAVELEAPIDLYALEESNTVDAEKENKEKGHPLSSLEISLHVERKGRTWGEVWTMAREEV